MIDEWDPKQQARLNKLHGQQAVGFAGATVTAGVVVHDQRAGHALAQEWAKDIGRTDLHAIDLTQGCDVAAANAVAGVQAKDVNRLLLAEPKLGPQQPGDIAGRSHPQAV